MSRISVRTLVTLIVGIAVFTINGPISAHGATEQYELDAVAATAYSDAYAAQDLSVMDSLLADDAIFEDPPTDSLERKTLLKD